MRGLVLSCPNSQPPQSQAPCSRMRTDPTAHGDAGLSHHGQGLRSPMAASVASGDRRPGLTEEAHPPLGFHRGRKKGGECSLQASLEECRSGVHEAPTRGADWYPCFRLESRTPSYSDRPHPTRPALSTGGGSFCSRTHEEHRDGRAHTCRQRALLGGRRPTAN